MATLKIAVATPDGEHLSPHFGETPWYEVFTVEEGQIVARERRAKPHHSHDHEHGHDDHHHAPGMGRGGQHFFESIRDCQVLIVGGMGRPAYEWARTLGLEVIPARGTVEEVVRAYLAGTLQADMRRVHRAVGGHHH